MRITVDAHNDTLMKIIDPDTWTFANNIGISTPFNIDLDKMEKGQTNIALFAAYTDDLGHPDISNSYLLAMMHALDQTVSLNPSRLAKVKTLSQLHRALEAGKRVAIQTIEGAYPLNEMNARALLEQYRDLGVRMITLVWDHSNNLGEGTLKRFKDGEKTSGGLTKLGKKVLGWMEDLGILVDVSHMDEETFWSTIESSRKPVIASHSGAYSVKAHVRNLKDSQLRAIAKTGGIVNLVFCRFFIGDVTSGVATLLDHIEHVIQIAGVHSVGLGSDFDGATMPVDLPDMSYMQLIASGLKERGHSDQVIDQVMGGNMLRILENTLNSSGPAVAVHALEYKGNELKLAVPDLSVSSPALVLINGIERPHTLDKSKRELVCKKDVLPDQRYFLATVVYRNLIDEDARITIIVKHPIPSA